MAPAAKRPASKSTKRARKASLSTTGPALATAASKAAGLLSQPEVREQLVEFGKGLNKEVWARVEARRAARPQKDGSDGPRSHSLRQQRLEKRADRLSENLELLREATGEESTAAVDSMADVVARLRLALAVANNLPLRRRVSAQNEIAAALDTLERAVLSATMPEDAGLPQGTAENGPEEEPDDAS